MNWLLQRPIWIKLLSLPCMLNKWMPASGSMAGCIPIGVGRIMNVNHKVALKESGLAKQEARLGRKTKCLINKHFKGSFNPWTKNPVLSTLRWHNLDHWGATEFILAENLAWQVQGSHCTVQWNKKVGNVRNLEPCGSLCWKLPSEVIRELINQGLIKHKLLVTYASSTPTMCLMGHVGTMKRSSGLLRMSRSKKEK